MSKDVLLVKAGQYHIAFPTCQLLEIIDLKEYEKTQSRLHSEMPIQHQMDFRKNRSTQKNEQSIDQFRLWREHVLPVIHMGNYLDENIKATKCRYSLVYQTMQQEILFLDVDHFFSILHMDTTQLRPIFNPYKKLAEFSSKVCYVPGKEVLAFFLDENHQWNPQYNSNNPLLQSMKPSGLEQTYSEEEQTI